MERGTKAGVFRPLRLSRRAFVLGLVVGGGTLLAGCSPSAAPAPTAPPSKPTSPLPPVSPQPAAPTQAPTAQPVTQPSSPVQLTLWYIAQGTAFVPPLKAAVEAFESSHRGVKVQLEEMPSGTLRPKLQTVMTTGGPGPDLVYEGAVHTQRYASYPIGYLPIAKYVNGSGIKSRIAESIWAPTEFRGEIYALPINAIFWYLAYNNELYGNADIKGPPLTWDELLETVKKTTDPARNVFGFNNQTDRFVIWILETLWYQSGVGWFEGSEDYQKYDLTKPLTFHSPKGVEALKFLRSLMEFAPGGPKGSIGVGNDALVSQMAQVQIASMYHLMLYIAQVPQQNPKLVGGKNLRIAHFPRGPQRGGGAVATSALGITKGSKNPDAAWEFVQFISDKWEGQLATSIGGYPVRRDAVIPPEKKDDWLLQLHKEALEQGFPQGFFPQWDPFREIIGKEVQAYFLDQKTAEQALADAATACAAVLNG